MIFVKFLKHGKKGRCFVGEKKEPGLALSEIMCIMIVYHLSGMKCFEYYYHELVEKEMRPHFPGLPCYECFIALIPRTAITFLLLVNLYRQGRKKG